MIGMKSSLEAAGCSSIFRSEIEPMKKSQKESGFTLIEVILALGLTAMLLGLLSTSVFIVAEDWNRNSDVLDDSLDDALAILQIDRSLHGAFPHSFTDEETLSRQIYFTGQDDYLSWVSTVSPQRTAGLTTWELYSVDEEGVFLTMVPAYSDDPTERLLGAEPILLFEDYTAQELLSLPLAVHIRFDPVEEEKEVLEVLARIRNNEHRSIQPNVAEQISL